VSFVRANGQAELYAGKTGTTVHLTVDGLRPPAGHVYNYELWCVRSRDGWKISAGTFPSRLQRPRERPAHDGREADGVTTS